MAKGRAYIGTSGWHYKTWQGVYYPEELKTGEWLAYYAKRYKTTEINNSFYRLPKPETVLNWVAQVPKRFKFCPKISRYLSHTKRLLEPEEALRRFFDVFDLIKKHMGPVLVQLPPNAKFNYDRAEHFFQVLKKQYSDYYFALEVRHDTWMENDSLDLMAKYNISFVISQSGVGFPYSELVTAKNIYLRFHGPGELYASAYTDKMLQEFADKFKKWMKEGHTIWAFFNNDWYANAIKDSYRLMQMLE